MTKLSTTHNPQNLKERFNTLYEKEETARRAMIKARREMDHDRDRLKAFMVGLSSEEYDELLNDKFHAPDVQTVREQEQFNLLIEARAAASFARS